MQFTKMPKNDSIQSLQARHPNPLRGGGSDGEEQVTSVGINEVRHAVAGLFSDITKPGELCGGHSPGIRVNQKNSLSIDQ